MTGYKYLSGVKKYIEQMEVEIDAEYGKGRSFEELVEAGKVTNLYYETVKRIQQLDSYSEMEEL